MREGRRDILDEIGEVRRARKGRMLEREEGDKKRGVSVCWKKESLKDD